MLDPVKNAKTLGVLFIVLGLIGLVMNFVKLNNTESAVDFLGIGTSVGTVIVGYGLMKLKKWAIWGFGILTLIDIILLLINISSGVTDAIGLVVTIIYGLLFFLFFSARNRFS